MSAPDDHPADAASGELGTASLQELLHLLPAGVLRAAPDGVVTWMNPAAARLLAPRMAESADFDVHALLAPWAPDLAARVQAHGTARGVVHRWRLGPEGGAVRSVMALKLQHDPGGLTLLLMEGSP